MRCASKRDTETRRGGDAEREEKDYALAVEESEIVREERGVYDARVEMWRAVLREIAAVDIGNMTPVQALNLLNELHMRVKELENRAL